MTTKTLYLLRGVSGCGKTTLANNLSELPNTATIAADDYWYYLGNGEYAFDINRLPEAHSWCRESVEGLMGHEYNIVVHNTNTSEKEIKPYLDLAEKYGYLVISLVIEKRHTNENVHNVPEEALKRQESKLRNSIKLN